MAAYLTELGPPAALASGLLMRTRASEDCRFSRGERGRVDSKSLDSKNVHIHVGGGRRGMTLFLLFFLTRTLLNFKTQKIMEYSLKIWI